MEQTGVERSPYRLRWITHTSAVNHFCVKHYPHFLYIILNQLATNPTVFCFKSMEGGEPLVEPYPFLMDLLQRAGALHHVQNFVSARITTLVDFKAVEKTDLIALGIVELGLRNAIMRLVEESVTADKAKARLAAKTGGIVFSMAKIAAVDKQNQETAALKAAELNFESACAQPHADSLYTQPRIPQGPADQEFRNDPCGTAALEGNGFVVVSQNQDKCKPGITFSTDILTCFLFSCPSVFPLFLPAAAC